jgi:hypothetical protein
MGKFRYRVYPQLGDAPLANGNPPLVEPEEGPATGSAGVRLLMWIGVIISVYVGIWLTGKLLSTMRDDILVAGGPVGWYPVAVRVCMGAWLALCIGVAVWRWRRSR